MTPDLLPPLDRIHPISEATQIAYREQGYVHLREVCSPYELLPYADAIRDACMSHAGSLAPLEDRDTYGKAFIQVTNLWQRDHGVAKFVLAKRFARIAAELMGVPAVRLYHDQALFKEPGGGHTPWHQDQYYWPLDGAKTITMWMPLASIQADMMAMKFAVASHLDGPVTMLDISDSSERFFAHHIAEHRLTMHQIQEMTMGDATFHDGWTIHGAPGNLTDRRRDVMTVIYYEDGAAISEPQNDARKNDLRTWFPGQQPGERAGTELNPLLFSQR